MRAFLVVSVLCLSACAAEDLALRDEAEGFTGSGGGGIGGDSPEAGPLVSDADGGTESRASDAGLDPNSTPEAVYDGGYELGHRQEDHPCEALCAMPERAVCGLHFLHDEERCVASCIGALDQMLPPARQAWLRCGLDRCQVDRPVDCAPGHFMGPPASADCLRAAMIRQRCEPERTESLWRDVWECEGLRSPQDQPDLGGRHMVRCLASQEACGFAGFYQCLRRAEEQSGRGPIIRQACAQASRCDESLGGECLMALVGLTPQVGGQRVGDVEGCLRSARGHCPDIERCLHQRSMEEWNPRNPCRASCDRCRGGPDCGENCQAVYQSLSKIQAHDFGLCLGRLECEEDRPAVLGCLEEVLPETARACGAFENRLESVCHGQRNGIAASSHELRVACALSGLRTGLADTDALIACIDRVGCLDDPATRCLRGR